MPRLFLSSFTYDNIVTILFSFCRHLYEGCHAGTRRRAGGGSSAAEAYAEEERAAYRYQIARATLPKRP